MSRWPVSSVGAVAVTFDGPHATPKTVDRGPIFLGIDALDNGRIRIDSTRHVTENDFKKWTKRVKPQEGDIVFSYETRLGQAAIIPKGLICCLGRRMALVRPNESLLDNKFFLYYFMAPKFQEQIRKNTINGATVDRIPLKSFPSFEIELPGLGEQKSIASILGALDDKIDLNRRTNETLEAMARALFRDWFVDFGPTRAKMAGQAPYLAPEIWKLFPDRLDDEGKPEGWDDSLVGRQFDVTMGQSPPGDTYNPDGIGIPFYQGKTDFDAVFPQRRMYCTAPTRFANTLDSLVSVRAPVGDVNLSEEKCCIGRGLASVRHPQNLPYYTYFTMKFLRDVFSSFESNGTVFGSINKKQFEELSVIESGFEKLFERQVMPTCSKIVANETENRNRAQLRDLLLPKLMSGEIRIRDAERMGADAL
ncbi:MAG: restriction endonuclease subunit S [Gluconobacter oxydans]